VARECGIIHQNNLIFVGRLKQEVETDTIHWEEVDKSDVFLDPATLKVLEYN
jgi:hypothetical protein